MTMPPLTALAWEPDRVVRGLQVFLVGGAVRDHLLGLPVREKDYVIVGSTPDSLLQKGFVPVGKDFPVFLHPVTQAEYALARTERKTGSGYRGFVCDASPEVTLELDLKRRDLTVNAMAVSPDGVLHDPWNGYSDLCNRILRHVSPAFSEDPVRLLRAARFMAQLGDHAFFLAPETQTLLRQLVLSGEVAALQPERVWKECERALLSNHPELFLTTLQDCGALPVLLDAPASWKPVASGAAQRPLTELPKILAVRWAAVVSRLGLHEVPAIKRVSERLRCPHDSQELALLWANWEKDLQEGMRYRQERDATAFVRIFSQTDAWRRPERFVSLCALLPPLVGKLWENCLLASQSIRARDVLAKRPDLKGPAVGEAVHAARLQAIDAYLKAEA